MATSQIRDVPEESYAVLRRQARQAGQSMQAYLREQIVQLAARPSKGEAVATIEAVLGRVGGPGPDDRSLFHDLVVPDQLLRGAGGARRCVRRVADWS
jgi:hypothetical protein